MQLVKGADTYTLPTYVRLKGLAIATRNKDYQRTMQHGSVEAGDNTVDARSVELEILLIGTSATDHDTQMETLMKYLYRKDQKLFYGPRADRYINISRLDKTKHEYVDGYAYTRSKINVTLKALDPFIYTTAPATSTKAITTTPQQFTVTNTGNIDTPAVLSITATANCPSIKLINLTDDSIGFEYSDIDMLAGQVLVIDTNAGTVARGGLNTINGFSGSFPRLVEGSNTFQYEGARCSIKFDFTPRWF